MRLIVLALLVTGCGSGSLDLNVNQKSESDDGENNEKVAEQSDRGDTDSTESKGGEGVESDDEEPVAMVEIVSATGKVIGQAPENDSSLVTLSGTSITIRIEFETGGVALGDQQPCIVESAVCADHRPERCFMVNADKVAVPPPHMPKGYAILFLPDVDRAEISVMTDDNDAPTGLTPWYQHVERLSDGHCKDIDPNRPKENQDDLFFPAKSLQLELPLSVAES